MSKALIFGVVVALLLPSPVSGQAQVSGTVIGRVVDGDGNPIRGAVVGFSGPAIQGERSVATRADGRFLASLLPAGAYMAVVLAPAYQAAVFELRVGVGETVPLEVTLLPGEDFAEAITVTGRLSPLAETAGGARFDYETDIEELPIQNRNINLMAHLAPNVSLGPGPTFAAIAGAPAFDTIVLLDGAEISTAAGPALPLWLEDAIQEVQVLTTGISARYGRTQGGVINAITKSGGNEFSGTLRAELSREDWNSKTPFGEDQSDELDETYQGTLGGFILRDRLWFFGGVYYTPTDTFTITPVFGDSIRAVLDDERYQIKLRGAVTPSHTVDVSYLDLKATARNRAGLPPGEPRATANAARLHSVASVIYQGLLGRSAFLDVHVTKRDVSIVGGGRPEDGDPFLDNVAFRVYNNHWWDIDDTSIEDNRTASATLTYAFDTPGFGSHLLEGGLQWVESTAGGDNRQSPTGFNYLALTPGFVEPELGPDGRPRFNLFPFAGVRFKAFDLGAENEVENVALFAQDSITWRDWRLDVGFRWERYRGTTTGVQAFDLSFDDFSPRLGVTHNITPSWQVMGSYAKYVGRFNEIWGAAASGVLRAPRLDAIYIGPELTGLTADELSEVLRNEDLWLTIGMVGNPDFPTTFLTSDVRSPFAEEFNLSVRHALPRNAGYLALTFTNRDFRQLMTGFAGLVCTDFGLSFDLACPDGEFVEAVVDGQEFLFDTTVWGNDPRTRRDYQALALSGDFRPSTRLTLGGNWTWSRTRGDYEGESPGLPASGSVHGFYERGIPLESAAPYGFLNPHITHRMTGWGTCRWSFDRWGRLATSAIFTYRTGRVWSRTATVPRAFVPEYVGQPATYIHFFDGRGNNEFNSVWSLDFAARWALPIWSRLDAWVKVDVQNILNRDTLTSYLTTGTWAWSDSGTRTPGDDPNRHRVWVPAGNCTPDDEPSTTCTGFGRIDGPGRYQTPRTYLFTVGLQF
jgi:hypothetical protein